MPQMIQNRRSNSNLVARTPETDRTIGPARQSRKRVDLCQPSGSTRRKTCFVIFSFADILRLTFVSALHIVGTGVNVRWRSDGFLVELRQTVMKATPSSVFIVTAVCTAALTSSATARGHGRHRGHLSRPHMMMPGDRMMSNPMDHGMTQAERGFFTNEARAPVQKNSATSPDRNH
jgi:hypothetical protein